MTLCAEPAALASPVLAAADFRPAIVAPAGCFRPAEAGHGAANPPLAALSEALRAPLIPLIGFAELLAGTPLPPELARHHAAEIAGGGRALLAVLDAMLALAAGRRPDPGTPPDAAAAAEDAMAALRRLLAGPASGR